MSPVPNRPAPRASGSSSVAGRRPQATRTVLLGYLLRKGADDRVSQIVARCEPTRLRGFLAYLTAEERLLLAALLVRLPAACRADHVGEAVLRELFGPLGPSDVRRVLSEASPSGLALAMPYLSRRAAADARRAGLLPDGDPPPRPRVEAAFRLRRLFVT